MTMLGVECRHRPFKFVKNGCHHWKNVITLGTIELSDATGALLQPHPETFGLA
jgi:hypothetical protein